MSTAAGLLARASKPVLVAGSRLRPPEARSAFRKLADASGYAVAVLPAAKSMFPEDHPAYTGIYWGPVSSAGVAETVESADAYLFAGAILSDYATTGYSALIDPKKLLLANSNDVSLPDASYSNVTLAEFLEGLAEKVVRNATSLGEFNLDCVRTPFPMAKPDPSAPLSTASTEFQGPVDTQR